MRKHKTDKLDDGYARSLAPFEKINPQPPGGISREVFLDLVMQRLMFRERLKPMTDTEREVAIQAIVSTFIAEEPTSPSDAMLLVMMFGTYEGIVHCQARSLDGSQPQIQREKDQAHALKAIGVYTKAMEVRSRRAKLREEGLKAERNGGIVKAIEQGRRRLDKYMASEKGNFCDETETRTMGLLGPPTDRDCPPRDGGPR